MGKGIAQSSLVQAFAEGGLIDRKVFSSWAPLWGFIGIGLPISFLGQVRPASMYLKSTELIGLYGTEWCLLAIFGLAATCFFSILDLISRRCPWKSPPGHVSRIGFAMVIGVAIFFGALAWIVGLNNSSPSIRPWIGLLVVLLLITGGVAASGKAEAELASIFGLARTLSLVGGISVFSFFSTAGHALVPPTIDEKDKLGGSGTNIVIITVDTLSASHLTPYGSARPTSPNIGEFAKHALVFDRFHSNSNFTTSSVASMMTGVEPWTHRVVQLQGKAEPQYLRESIPARLHEAGYLTAYFGSNPWAGGRLHGYSNYFDHKDSDLDWVFGPCFDRFADLLPLLCAAKSNRLLDYSYSAFEHAAAAVGLISIYPHSDVKAMVDRVVQWTHSLRNRHGPVFLWVHFFPPHDPYAAPKPWLGLFDASANAANPIDSHPAGLFEAKDTSKERLDILKARYDESIAYVDHYIGPLLSAVYEDLGSNTAVIFSADHGESFDHGYGNHGGVMLYEDLIHVPLIIRLPDGNAGRRDDLCSQIDLAPTIAELAGIPPSRAWTGRSLLQPELTADRPVFSMSFEENRSHAKLATGSVAILSGNWKFVRFFGEPRYPEIPVLHDKLFDLQADPHEYSDVSNFHPDIARDLSAVIDQQLSLTGGAVGD